MLAIGEPGQLASFPEYDAQATSARQIYGAIFRAGPDAVSQPVARVHGYGRAPNLLQKGCPVEYVAQLVIYIEDRGLAGLVRE